MKSEKGRLIHQQSLAAQEKGDFLKALQLADEAMTLYQEDGDEAGFAEIQAMRTLTYRHLFDQTGFGGYLIKAKHEAMASVDLAQESGDEYSQAIPLATLGRIMADLGEYPHGAENFKRAIVILEKYPNEEHGRKSVIADFKVHMNVCLYKAGDEGAGQAAEDALEELAAATDATEYERAVWISGGQMKLAEAIYQTDRAKANEHMRAAKTIIDNNESLKLRLAQWNKLMEKLKAE